MCGNVFDCLSESFRKSIRKDGEWGGGYHETDAHVLHNLNSVMLKTCTLTTY